MYKIGFLLMIFVSLLFTSCVDENSMLGVDLVDDTDRVNVKKYNDAEMTAIIYHEGDSLITSNGRYMPLGEYKDNNFGKVTASIFSQLTLSQKEFSVNENCDSVVLTLLYGGMMAKDINVESMPMEIEVYELGEPMTDSIYKAGNSIVLGNLIAKQSIDFKPKNQVNIGKDTIAPHLRIKLNDAFLDKLKNFEGDAGKFKEEFKGIYIKATSKSSNANGMIAYFDMYSKYSGLKLYYKKDTINLDYSFIFSDETRHFTNIKYDLSSSSISGIGNTESSGINQDENIYIGGLGISIGKINIKDLEKWYSSDTVQNLAAINQAMLILPVSELNIGDMYPSRIVCYRKDDNGKFIYINDALLDKDYFGGGYDKQSNSYRMRITSHLQNYLNGNIKSPDIYLIQDVRTYQANRVVLNGPKHSTKPAKLEILYTK